MRERWKPVVGFEDKYEISDQGRVRRRDTKVMLKLYEHKWNKKERFPYLAVTLYKEWNGHRRVRRVHSLVAEAFIGPRPKGYNVNHKDGNKRNNWLDNLEYVTIANNIKHAWQNGFFPDRTGTRNRHWGSIEPHQMVALAIEYETTKTSLRKLAKKHNITPGVVWWAVQRVRRGDGYIAPYIKEFQNDPNN